MGPGGQGQEAPLRMKWCEQVAMCEERPRQGWPVQRLSASTSKVKDSTARGSGAMSGVLCVAGPWKLLDQKAQPSVPVVQALPPGAPQSCPGVWLQAARLTAWVGGLPSLPCCLRQGQSILKL